MGVEEQLVSPWRTPEAMAAGQNLRLSAMQSARRGPRICSVDLKVLLFVLPHTIVPIILWSLNTPFGKILSAGLLRHSTSVTSDTMQLACYVALACLAVLTYSKLYASNPGWITTSSIGLQVPPCRLCGIVPTLRSRHCRLSGQCIHKMDHYCWVLSTAIGDSNHRVFYFTILVHVTLLWWLVLDVYDRATPCLVRALGSPRPKECFQMGPLGTPLLLLLALAAPLAATTLTYLLLLHTYLIATNQTTVELIKGNSVPYLYPFYLAHRGPLVYPVRGLRDLLRLVYHELRGTGPPKPFSEGVWRNLRQFFLTPRPVEYRYKMPLPPLASITQLLEKDEDGGIGMMV